MSSTRMYQIVNRCGRVVNGVWNGSTPMTKALATKRVALMNAQGGGLYKLRAVATRPSRKKARS